MNTIVLILAGLGGAAGVGLLIYDCFDRGDIRAIGEWWRRRVEVRQATEGVRRRVRRMRWGR